MWSTKYRPSTVSDIIGNEKEIQTVKDWGQDWSKDEPGIILYGPPGVGKTSVAHALANDMGWEDLEMNASDKRTKSLVQSIAGESSKTATLSGSKRKLIIIDEADNIHGHSDRGGKKAITSVIKESRQPIILIANDFYELSRSLRNKLESVEFSRVDTSDLARKLRDICENEGIDYEVDALKKIAENADGDIRGAINDLQKHGASGRISESDLEQHSRDKNEEIFPFMDDVLKSEGPKNVRNKSENLDLTPYDLYRWIEQNIYYEYDKEELRGGIKEVSKASFWLGIVNKTQNYKFWRYANDRLTAGVANQKSSKHGGWTRWQPPRYNNKKAVSESVVDSVSTKSRMSRNSVKNDVYPYLSLMIEYCKPEDLTSEISAWYDWNKKSIASVSGSGKSTNKVERIIENSEDIKSDFEVIDDEKDTNRQDSENQVDTDDSSDKSENKKHTDDTQGDQKTDESDTDNDQAGLEDFI